MKPITEQLADMETELARVRRSESQRRSEAWAAVPEMVLGLALRPITPATFALLHATGNAFVCGLPPVEKDVNDFLLFHSPRFDPDAPCPRFWPRFVLAMQLERAMCPRRFVGGMKRKAIRAGNVLRAIREIRAIVEETWADQLAPSDGTMSSTPLACALTGQLVDMFAREYTQWPLAQPVRHTPLKQLFQLARCSERTALGASDTYYNAKESAIISGFLARQNADPELVKQRREQSDAAYDASFGGEQQTA